MTVSSLVCLKRTYLFPVCALMMITTSCGKDKDEDAESIDEPITAPFLTAAELSLPGNLEDFSKTEMLAEISEESSIYDNQPADNEADNCLDTILNSTTVSGSANEIIFGRKIEVTECMTEIISDPDNPTKIESALLSMYGAFKCPGVDLTPYIGKTWKDIEGLSISDSCGSGASSLLNMKTEVRMKAVNEENSLTTNFKVINFQGTADLTPCERSSDGTNYTNANTCIEVTSNQYSDTVLNGKAAPEVLQNEFLKFSSADLKTQVKGEAVWHVGGKIDVTYNDWTGTLSYSAADQAPTYKFTKGTETAEGSITATAGLTSKFAIYMRPFLP